MKFDLHMHTSRHSPDSEMDPLVLIRRAQEIGLDGVVITEHDWLWTEAELEVLRSLAPGLVVLAGIEVSAREGHFLVYGVQDPFAVPRLTIRRSTGLRSFPQIVHGGRLPVVFLKDRSLTRAWAAVRRTRATLNGMPRGA